jgi:hypothetical protein
MRLEGLAARRVYEFAFVVQTLKISTDVKEGATDVTVCPQLPQIQQESQLQE